MKNLIKILLLNVMFAGTALCSHAAATFQQTITTTVPPSVSVTAINTAAASGTIDGGTGISSAPSASFRLQTNGDDAKYTYIVQATLRTGAIVNTNAYAQIASQEYVLLGNNGTNVYPTLAAVNDIKSGSPTPANNVNVIAYPVSNTINNLASITYTNNATYGGLCYIIKTGSSRDGTMTQKVGAAPLSGTFSIGSDRAGTYQAVVTLTANRNP